METNKIYNKDCLEGLKQLEDNSIDCVITDPPYGINMTSDGFGGSRNADKTEYVKVKEWDNNTPSKELFKEIIRVSKNQIIFGGNYFTDKLPVSRCWVCWDKRCEITPERTYADCEFIWTSFKSPSRIIRFLWDGFIQDSENKIRDKRLHPTQKPIEVIRRLLKRFTNENDIILDPFLGSGTTVVACKQLNRRYIGFEINEKYVNITNERLKQQPLKTKTVGDYEETIIVSV